MRQPTVTHAQQESVEDIADQIRRARDPLAEGQALKKLHDYAADRKYTYKVDCFTADTNKPVTSASTVQLPVRTVVSVYRAGQPVYTFSFIPQDNRNLTQIAADP